MPSKWSKLKAVLDPWKPEASYQERVDVSKQAYVHLSPTELARQFKMFDDQKDACERTVGNLNLELEALSQLIVSALTGSGVQTLELESGMKVALDEKIYIAVLDTIEARAAYDKWTNLPMIRKLKKLYVATRDGFVREEVLKAMIAGKPVPKQFTAWVELKYRTRAKLLKKKYESDQPIDPYAGIHSNGGTEDE